jgi:hypothetical protein
MHVARQGTGQGTFLVAREVTRVTKVHVADEVAPLFTREVLWVATPEAMWQATGEA